MSSGKIYSMKDNGIVNILAMNFIHQWEVN